MKLSWNLKNLEKLSFLRCSIRVQVSSSLLSRNLGKSTLPRFFNAFMTRNMTSVVSKVETMFLINLVMNLVMKKWIR